MSASTRGPFPAYFPSGTFPICRPPVRSLRSAGDPGDAPQRGARPGRRVPDFVRPVLRQGEGRSHRRIGSGSEGDISGAFLHLAGIRTSESGGKTPASPPRAGEGSSATAAGDGTNQPSGSVPAGELKPEYSPTFRAERDLLEKGEYVKAVLHAYRAAFEGTVHAYGLAVPPSCSDRQFLREFLRPDMGRLSELLPELYRIYEPVKFGRLSDGDPAALRGLLEQLYSETVLARIHDPQFQAGANGRAYERRSGYDRLFRSLAKGEKT